MRKNALDDAHAPGGVTGHQNVADVSVGEREMTCDLINETLKRLGGVALFKWHPHILEQSEAGSNRHFRDVGRFYRIW